MEVYTLLYIVPKYLENDTRHIRMADNIVWRTHKFFFTIAAYITEYLIDVINHTCRIRTTHNRFGLIPIDFLVNRSGVFEIWYHMRKLIVLVKSLQRYIFFQK